MNHLSTFDEAEADFNKIVFFASEKNIGSRKKRLVFLRDISFRTFVANLVKFLVKSGVGHKMILLVKC